MIDLDLEGGWTDLLEGAGRGPLEREALPAFLRQQRWFAGKARPLEAVRLVDATAPGELAGSTVLALVEARHRDGGADLYLVPLGIATGPDADRLAGEMAPRVLARGVGPDGPRVLFDALADPAVCEALLGAIAAGRQIPTRSGSIRSSPTDAFAEARGPAEAPLAASIGSADQSNSAVLFGDRLILKVFRRLEPGLNPDFEIGRFLTEGSRFDHIPKVAGAIEYDRPGDPPIMLGILQGLVRNEGTGWEHALLALRRYYEEAERRPAGSSPPAAPAGRSALEAASSEPLAEARAAIGPYLDAAATLGRRTAELHLALASDPAAPNFAPIPLTQADLSALSREIREQVVAALDALRENLDRLPEADAALGRRVLDGAPGLLSRSDALTSMGPAATKIRCHGDYHLGQVLWTGDDFVILDFEGEPAKPLAKRLEKQSPFKDVVGMLRSFDYAAYAGLFAAAQGRPEALERLAPWAGSWQAWTSAAFLGAYLASARGAPFLPADPAHAELLLQAFTLDKALYELLYELNNRPDWVRIPLRGISALIERGPDAGPARPKADAPEQGRTAP